MNVDLHCHSLFSDGRDTVEHLLAHALKQQLALLALTDHDTVEGVVPLQQLAESEAIRIIPGIEWSTRWKKYDIHILGLNIDPHHPAVHQMIKQQTQTRVIRAQLIAEKLKHCGIKEAYEKVMQQVEHGRIARPHFAHLIVQEGLAPDIKTAFARFLKKGQVAYVPTPWPSIDDVVAVTQAAGGDAVIAHPWKYGLTRTKLQELIVAFKCSGGVGLEVISGHLEDNIVNMLVHLSQRFDLWCSSGSDYHGEGLSRVQLGQQRALPEACQPIWQRWMEAA